MKRFLLLLILSFFLFSVNSFGQKKTVTQKILFIQPYCGGARPTPEMEANALKPWPYAHKTVIIISEKGNVDSVKTDKAGSFKKTLKFGKYKLLESWRYYKKTPDGTLITMFDKDCLSAEWQKEFKNISVSKEKITEEEKYQINANCPWNMPCLLEKYMPPRMRE